ncbi:hypothetical protein CBD41_05340 [bacterium TMED181]|nr:hypothetical protein [Planctomycetota bacterium]OUW44653.1 MAG: hypothetical protein CBD41_05340 [bacterium TMED181]
MIFTWAIYGLLVALGGTALYGWVSSPSGSVISPSAFWIAGVQVVGLAVSCFMAQRDQRKGRYWIVPLGVSLISLTGIALQQDPFLILSFAGVIFYGISELIWLILGRLKRGGGILLVLMLLIPIALGAYVLQSPRAQAEGTENLTSLEALFTAVSAVTVTGLSVIDVGSRFSAEGLWILLLLIQAGGLGAVSLFLLFMTFLGQGLGMRQGRAVREAMDGLEPTALKSLVWTIFGTTLVLECLGVLALTIFNRSDSEVPWFSHLFHSVSAFCNSGFALQADSLKSMNPASLLSVCFLIILGGIGFPVIWDVVKALVQRVKMIQGQEIKQRHRVGTHVYLSVGTSVLLWIFGALFLLLAGFKGLDSVFWSITARTAGFSTGSVVELNDFAILVLVILMLIGASPGSTGGGLKTSTVGVLFVAFFRQILGRKAVLFRNRTLPDKLIRSAAVLTVAFVSVWIVLLGLLHWTESTALKNGSLSQQQLVFEAASALGTVGLSMEATPQLSQLGCMVLMVGMILGRIGPLAIVVVLASLSRPREKVERPDAKVMLG